MPNAYTLDDLKADLDHEFAPLSLEIGGESVVLRNLMRINEKDRAAVLVALKEVEEVHQDDASEPSVEDVAKLSGAVGFILKTVVDKGKGDKLIKALDGDLMLAMRVMELWSEATQPGEAQNSPA